MGNQRSEHLRVEEKLTDLCSHLSDVLDAIGITANKPRFWRIYRKWVQFPGMSSALADSVDGWVVVASSTIE